MNDFLTNDTKNVALFLNDYDQEFADALVVLSEKLGRKLRGIIVVDSELKKNNRFVPDTDGVFEQIVCDFSDDKALNRLAKSLEDELLFITASAESNQPYLGRILPHMPYILGPTESSLIWSTQKVEMREMLSSYDTTLGPLAEPIMNDSDEEIEKIVSHLRFPLIVKPAGLQASILVSKVENEAELRTVVKNTFEIINGIYEEYSGRGDPELLVEEFVDGDRYSVDAYVNERGQFWSLPPIRSVSAYELGMDGFHTYQNESTITLTQEELAGCYDAAERATHALGLRSCVAHVELFKTGNDWKIIELGPRAGGQRQDLYFVSYGVDHALNEFLIKIGMEPEIKTEHLKNTMTVNVWVEEDNEGTITDIEGFDDVKQNPSFYNLYLRSKVGDHAATSTHGGKQVCVVVLANDDSEQLKRDAELVRASIKIITEK